MKKMEGFPRLALTISLQFDVVSALKKFMEDKKKNNSSSLSDVINKLLRKALK